MPQGIFFPLTRTIVRTVKSVKTTRQKDYWIDGRGSMDGGWAHASFDQALEVTSEVEFTDGFRQTYKGSTEDDGYEPEERLEPGRKVEFQEVLIEAVDNRMDDGTIIPF